MVAIPRKVDRLCSPDKVAEVFRTILATEPDTT